jgi:hypothetical protein
LYGLKFAPLTTPGAGPMNDACVISFAFDHNINPTQYK